MIFKPDRADLPQPTPEQFADALLPPGRDQSEGHSDRLFELYKLMVASSEALVARRQGVNTFFLTANGALLTGTGLVLQGGGRPRLVALGILVLGLTGAVLSFAWRSLLVSFGQLNTGKFAVINKLETELPAAIYAAEWVALAEGRNPQIYRSFTSREVWTPWATLTVYVILVVGSALVAGGLWHP